MQNGYEGQELKDEFRQTTGLILQFQSEEESSEATLLVHECLSSQQHQD